MFLLVWWCTDAFAGVILLRKFCWCDVVDVFAGDVVQMYLLVWCCICTTSHQQIHLYNTTPAKTSVQHHTSKNICTTPHQQGHLCNITSKNICTTSYQQKHLYITPAKTCCTDVFIWCDVDVFAGVVVYRCFCWCDVVQMFLSGVM
jgi:hypothetical protein